MLNRHAEKTCYMVNEMVGSEFPFLIILSELATLRWAIRVLGRFVRLLEDHWKC